MGKDLCIGNFEAAYTVTHASLVFSYLRQAEDGGEDPGHEEVDARQLLAELHDRTSKWAGSTWDRVNHGLCQLN